MRRSIEGRLFWDDGGGFNPGVDAFARHFCVTDASKRCRREMISAAVTLLEQQEGIRGV